MCGGMALTILNTNLDNPEFLRLKPFTKLKTSVAKFTGATFPLATCVKAGFSGLVEPAFDTAVVGQLVQDGFAQWKVSRKPGVSSGAGWHNLHSYSVGQQVRGSAKHVATPGTVVIQATKNRGRVVGPAPGVVVAQPVTRRAIAARLRRDWLSRIWSEVLGVSDRADWVSYAASLVLINWDGTEKVYSGFELFQLCAFPVTWPLFGLPSTWAPFYATLPAYGLLGAAITMPLPPGSLIAPHAIDHADDLGSAQYVLYPDYPPPPDATPDVIGVYGYASPRPAVVDWQRDLCWVYISFGQYSTPSFPGVGVGPMGFTTQYFIDSFDVTDWMVGFRIQRFSVPFTTFPSWVVDSVPGPLFAFPSSFVL